MPIFRPSPVVAEVYSHGVWRLKKFEDIKKGDMFRTYKNFQNNELNMDYKGNCVFIAEDDCRSYNGFEYKVECSISAYNPDEKREMVIYDIYTRQMLRTGLLDRINQINDAINTYKAKTSISQNDL